MVANTTSWIGAKRRIVAGLAVAIAVSLALTACGGSGSSTKPGAATLTVWIDGRPDATHVGLARAFEKLHPRIKIRLVAQPSSNYFALVHTANVARKGPDIELLWTGYYVQQNAPWLVKLNSQFSQSTLSRLVQPQYSALDYNVDKGLYIAPVATQYYVGMYNKALFARAGITAPPRTWTELYDACGRLKRIGVTPFVYGNQANAGVQSSFYVAFDLGYLLAGALSPDQWSQLYTGAVRWNSPALVTQLANWAKLYDLGCTNRDALTNNRPFQAYARGKAAMVVTGDWMFEEGALPKAVLRKSAPFLPPFTDSPKQNLVAMSGYGFGATTYGDHVTEAVEFLKFLETTTAQNIVMRNLNPEVTGLPPGAQMNAQHRQLLDWTEDSAYTLYPFVDNVVQPAVYSAAQSVLPQTFVGQKSPQSALDAVQKSLEALPADQRSQVSKGS
jgi:raffinose/stachyose/melibiose transport system substrate-binding protein